MLELFCDADADDGRETSDGDGDYEYLYSRWCGISRCSYKPIDVSHN